MADKGYSLEAAIEHLQRIQKMGGSRSWRVVVRKHNPGGMSGHGTTEVDSIHAGFDWEAGRVVIHPAKPLTELTPEQVEAIEKSVRAGGSWHAYEAQKKLRERALKAEARVAELEEAAQQFVDDHPSGMDDDLLFIALRGAAYGVTESRPQTFSPRTFSQKTPPEDA